MPKTEAVTTGPSELPRLSLGWDVLWWTTRYIRQPDGPDAGDEWHFTPEQVRFILNWYGLTETGRWTYMRGVLRRSKGWGKALSLDSVIPTSCGWTTMGEVKPGDEVLGAHGQPTKVRAVSPVWLDEPCYRVGFSDGEAVVCNGEHLWTVESLRAGYRTVTVTTAHLAANLRRADGACNWRLPMPAPLELPRQYLPVDPYVLGAWLGDGSRDAGQITNPDPEVWGEIVSAGYSLGALARREGKCRRQTVLGLRGELRDLGVLHDKHVPPLYLRGSKAQRLALLHGLMDTDGFCDEAGTCEFCTTTPALADAVVELLATLGIKCGITEGEAALYGRATGPKWRIKFTAHADMPVFRLARKRARQPIGDGPRLCRTRRITSVDRVPSVPTRCISVEAPDGLFLVGRRMVQTHNTPFVAALSLAELCGPVRFESWARGGETRPWRPQPYKRGEPIAGPAPAAWVQLAGVSQDQTNNTMLMVLAMTGESDIVDHYGLDLGITRINNTVNGGRLERITASAPTAEGARPTAVFEDETQHYTVSSKGIALDQVNRRNVGKSPGGTARVLETTNAHAAGEQSVAELSYEAYLAMRDGRARGQGRLLYDSREAPPDVDMSDEGSLMAGLEAAYGDSTWVDLERIRDEVWDPSTPPSDSRRFYLNQIAAAVDAWIAQPEWAGCVDAAAVVGAHDTVTLGFDGSRQRSVGVADATALIGCRVSDGHLFEVGVWEQPRGPAGVDWAVPQSEVEAAVHYAFATWNVVGMFADPALWWSVIGEWEGKYQRQLKVKATRQRPMQLHLSPTRVADMAAAFHGAVVDGQLTHDGSYRLTQHVLNARRRVRPGGTVLIDKEHSDSANKIDAAVAATYAWAARLAAVSLGISGSTFAPRRIR